MPQFPAEDGGEALAIRTFEKGALPFHADFSAVDLKEKEDLQHANDETNGMIIGLTWWNPIAWVGTPIVLVCLAAQNRDEQTFAQEIDKIQLGARLSDVTKALGDASARISRPDNIVYLVYARSYGIATIGFRDGVVRGVYPVHDARTAAKTSSF
ncbi:MAG TPA: hypothetical protein VFE47_22060 [Tepidisphaeraceae bacterium]|nr:hypothetical protein [Tepidisphaeraceae bacterium]